jgi:cytosine/adenosine deaminase-related metal-dependent hydrolase
MMTTLLHDAMILTLDARDTIIDDGYVLVQDDRIAEIGRGSYAGTTAIDRRIDCSDRLVTPGLVNAHTHSQSSTMAGFGDRLSHPAFMWLTQAHTSRRNPDEIRLSVLHTAYGLITSGTTAAIDHFPGQRFSLADMDAVLSAWRETGMRAALGMRFFDGAFSDIFPAVPIPDDLKSRISAVELLKPQPTDELAGLMDATIRKWHRRPRLSVFPAPSNPDRCSDKALILCAELAKKHDTGIHTHLLETKKQQELAQKRYGKTMVRHLDDLGVLSDRWSCAHSIWLTDEDIDLMAERKATAVLNPESNSRIGTGLARAPLMHQRGVRIAIGTDGASCNDNLVLQEAMRGLATAHRSSEPDRSRWITANEVFRMATAGGAGALRQDKLGTIAPGFIADLVVYRLDSPWWVPINDVVSQFVFAETGASADTVLVDGRIVMENRKIKTFDVEALVREVRAMTKSLRQRNADLFDVAEDIADFVP